MIKFKVNNSVSVSHIDNKELLGVLNKKSIIGVQNAGQLVTTPNINVPLGALAYIKPKAIEVLTAARMADKVSKPQKNGVWSNKAVSITVKEYTGKTTPDDGLADNGTEAKTNYSNVLRGVYYYTTHWMATDIEEATIGAFQDTSYRDSQINAAMRTLAIDRNKFFFRGLGYKGLETPIYGLLNDPNLRPYITVSDNGEQTSSTYWKDKTPEQIKNDIVAAYQTLIDQSNSLVNEELSTGKLILAIAGGSIGQLSKANQYGLTAKSLLKEEFGDKLEILSIPEFNNADTNSDVFYLIFVPAGEEPTCINSYVEMARAYPIFVRDSETSQKLSAATSGCIVQFPLFIVRYNGIGQTA